jgi:hypothetical protein
VGLVVSDDPHKCSSLENACSRSWFRMCLSIYGVDNVARRYSSGEEVSVSRLEWCQRKLCFADLRALPQAGNDRTAEVHLDFGGQALVLAHHVLTGPSSGEVVTKTFACACPL